MDNKVLRAIVEKYPDNTDRDNAEELVICPISISHHLKMIGKVEKNG